MNVTTGPLRFFRTVALGLAVGLLAGFLALPGAVQAAEAQSPPPLDAATLGYDIAEEGLDGRTFIVSPEGDDRNGGSVERPMRTPQAAADRVRPGDTVLLRGGEYTNEGAQALLEIKRGGTRRRWVRFASYPGETAVLRFDGLRGIRVAGVNHVVIEGFEIVGAAEQIDPAEALAFANAFQGRDFSQQRFFGVGIRLGDHPGERQHHIIIRGNRIHHTPGGGISTAMSDQVLVEGNHVFKTSFYSPWGESGISLWRSVDSDGDRSSYKMVVKDNVVHQNDNRVAFWMIGRLSDGNGIILDANDASPGAGSEGHRRYRGRFLVVNNVCFGNGGRGIHVYETSNVDLVHNTVHHNATRADIGHEIQLGRTDRVRVVNNLIVAGEETVPIGGYESERFGIDFNLTHGGKPAEFPLGAHGIAAVPGFAEEPPRVTPEDAPARVTADVFGLRPDSPAVQAGDPASSFPVDVQATARLVATPPDLGAKQRVDDPPAGG